MIDMPFRMFHCIYRSAWLESESRRKEAEEAEKLAKKEEQKEKQANRGGRGANQQNLSSRQALEQMRGISDGDLEEIAEEIGIV